MSGPGHIPVMAAEMLAMLAPRDGGRYLDATFGGGGYSRAILNAARCSVVALDRDPDAIARGEALVAAFAPRLMLRAGRFGALAERLAAEGIAELDGAVFDLGVSSFQLDDPARGFSFRADGPLDMRMDRAGRSAAELLARLDARALAELLSELGEERAARRVARAIVAARAEAPILTTGRLAAVIRAALPPDPGGIDPATRSFQALRIAVNDELGELDRGLDQAARLLTPGGRLVVVSFHSLEDRPVKRFMLDAAGRAPSPSRHDPRGLGARAAPRFRLLTPRALRPGAAEIAANPRARSARLRALARLEAA